MSLRYLYLNTRCYTTSPRHQVFFDFACVLYFKFLEFKEFNKTICTLKLIFMTQCFDIWTSSVFITDDLKLQQEWSFYTLYKLNKNSVSPLCYLTGKFNTIIPDEDTEW